MEEKVMSNEVVTQNNEIAKHENRPKDVVIRATEAAKELQRIVNARSKKLLLNGKQYLYFEDWQTLGKFDNITAKVVETSEIHEDNKLIGFSAKAVALKDGIEISAAEAECCFDEQNWRNKPRFQLKSMAQTRACAKALRNCLAFIAVLANYEPTPAEEMDDVNDNSKPAQKPENTDPATAPQKNLIKKKLLSSHLMTDKEKERLEKKVNNGLSKQEASNIISWWLGDKEKGTQGERAVREQQESLEQDQLLDEEGNADFEPEMFEPETVKHK
jgi:hypothetical protein